MTLPPFLRQIQQSYMTHLAIAALIAGAGLAFTCFAKDNTFTFECARGGLIAAGIYLFGSLQHSPGSASFKPDGTVNQPVVQVVKMQAQDIPVKVVAAK